MNETTIKNIIHDKTLLVKKLDSAAILPKYKTPGAAGLDLAALHDYLIAPQMWCCVRTGIAVELPYGCEGQIRPRSGIAVESGVTVLNSPGTIDSDYRGEIIVALINHSIHKSFSIRAGDRIAQLVISPVARVAVKLCNLSKTSRGAGGFGSTGTR